MASACGTLLPQSGPIRPALETPKAPRKSKHKRTLRQLRRFLLDARASAGNSFHIQEEEMLKKHMAACLVATAFIAAPALAQTSGSGSTSAAPAASSAAGAQSGQFMTHMQPNQWRGSKMMGVDIYGQNNEKIGDVNEVLIDRNGNADAIVVGVGGFLGIGEKDVAIPFSAVQWKYDRNDLSTASTTRAPATATNPPASGSTAMTNAPATTGTAGTANRAATDRADMDRGYPDHGVVSMTKDQIKNAPTFRYSMTDASTAPARTTAPANPNAPATTAPATAPKQ
jgi:sporulation protein YlmC with PRC-barrel domain